MIGEIIREVYGDSEIVRDLVEIPIVVSCLFRSFDEFTQNVIFRMTTNGGTIEKKEFLALMDRNYMKREGQEKFEATMFNLERLKIVSRSGFDNPQYIINSTFELKLNEYLEKPFKKEGERLRPSQYDDEFFNLLALLRESNEILRECKLGRVEGGLTKENFDFIRLPIGYKISILIKGYLTYKRRHKNNKIIRDVLCLSLMRHNQRYQINERTEEVIRELEMLRLVKRVENNEWFIINEYLEDFAFSHKQREDKLLDCSIIIETNFKVYAQLPPSHHQNFSLLRDILRSLLEIDMDDYNFEELIVGTITKQKMIEIFSANIGVNEFLSFFKNYMYGNLSIEKDLGKWNKIHYLGLQGPSEDLMIPNNVKQELKLWHSVYDREGRNAVVSMDDAEQDDNESDHR